jgi:hypothetical protein
MTRLGEVQVGRRIASGDPRGLTPVRQMVAQDRIRLTGSLRERPSQGGLSYAPLGYFLAALQGSGRRADAKRMVGLETSRSHKSVLAFANLPPTSAESLPTYRRERGTHKLGRIAGICRVAQLFQREPVS